MVLTAFLLFSNTSKALFFLKKRNQKLLLTPVIISTEHGLKSSAYLVDTLKDPETTHSFAVTKTAFNKAYRTDLPQWTWFELPEQKADLRAFGIAMRGSATLQLHDALLDCKRLFTGKLEELGGIS